MNALMRCCASLLLALPLMAFGHAGSQAYLMLNEVDGGVQLRADLPLRDVAAELPLDADGDGLLRWGELRAAEAQVQAWAQAGIRLCEQAWQPTAPLQIEQRGDAVYAVLQWRSSCAAGPLRYTLFAALDPMHRALLQQGERLQLLDPGMPLQAAGPSFWREGMHHLITGFDHMLFLLCLLLPAVLRRTPGLSRSGWQPVARLRDALGPITGIVTAFTLAHSLTLGLAAAGWLLLPGRVVEPLIAASIVLAALDNLWPVLPQRRWLVAFGFGLVHGFGFAGVLAEVELPPAGFAWALLQFNLGLEAAQLGVVLVATGLLFGLRRWAGYPRWVLGTGSGAAALLGLVWVVQRIATH